MRSILATLVTIAVLQITRAGAPPGYYGPVLTNGSPIAFRVSLWQAISTNVVTISEEGVRAALVQVDSAVGAPDSVNLIYSTSNAPAAGDWAIESLWPHLDFRFPAKTNDPVLTDLVNLRPCDAATKKQRGTKYFGKNWEPPPDERGDIARALFYLAARYLFNRTDAVAHVLTDYEGSAKLAGPNYFGSVSALVAWHKADPVDQTEQERNEVVYRLQGNRNPFVDHPEWADLFFAQRVDVYHTGVQMILHWWEGFPVIVESASSPAGPWTRFSSSPPTMWTAQEYRLEIAATNPAAFFRLRSNP